jgi:lauroyl/myristoyl acyltransferase
MSRYFKHAKKLLLFTTIAYYFKNKSVSKIKSILRKIENRYFKNLRLLDHTWHFIVKFIFRVNRNDLLDQALKYRKGVLIPILNAYANWHIIQYFVLQGHPVNLVVDHFNDKNADNINRLISQYRTILKRKLYDFKVFKMNRDSGMGPLLSIHRALQNNEIILFLFDGYYQEDPADSTKFLNADCNINPLFFQLSQKYHVPVLPLVNDKKGMFRVDFRFDRIYLMDKHNFTKNIQQITAFFEKHILACPYYWFGWDTWGLHVSKKLSREKSNIDHKTDIKNNSILVIDDNKWILFHLYPLYYLLNKTDLSYYQISDANIKIYKKLFKGIRQDELRKNFASEDEYQAFISKLDLQ